MEESSKKVGELIQHKKMQLQKVSQEYQARVAKMQEMMAAQEKKWSLKESSGTISKHF